MYKRTNLKNWVVISVFLVVLGANQTVRGKDWSITPGKFIPTFAVKYGNTQGWPPAAEAARFDLIDVSASMAHARVHASSRGNTWQSLKHLNPHIRIFLYKNGPAIYNVASWGQLGKGWKWLTENHGVGNADRWTAVGLKYAGCLQGTPYPNECLMNMANLNWQRYWAEQTNIKLWSGSQSMGEDADGIFADNCGYRMPWQGQWHLNGHPDKLDMPRATTRARESISPICTSLTSSSSIPGLCPGFMIGAMTSRKTSSDTGKSVMSPLNRFPRMVQEHFVSQVRQIEKSANRRRAKLKPEPMPKRMYVIFVQRSNRVSDPGRRSRP